MNSRLQSEDLGSVTDRLLALDNETTWAEFKENKDHPPQIGEYISALSNSAALEGRRRAYMLWGVVDATHEVVGTTFSPDTMKVKNQEVADGGEELMSFLTRQLSPQIFFQFHMFEHRGQSVVLLEIEPSAQRPVSFAGVEYIRIGSYKKRLQQHEDHERRLWRLFDTETYENSSARDRLSVEDVVELIDYPAYFRLIKTALPENRSLIIEILEQEGIVAHDVATNWSITNRGALLFANNLDQFPSLARKSPRVVQYRGNSRVHTVREQVGKKGYASGFQGLIGYVSDLLPENEVIGKALRESQLLYPELALRELIANALVHQDLTIPGSGPMIEIFDDRIEITNPGTPLVQPERFIDSPPQSRNERLARMMRQMGICEERGSGWDKVTFEVEFHQLPPPLVEVTEIHTKVVLFAPRPLAGMEKDDRVRAVYQHACLKYVNREHMTNSTVRQRFGIGDRSAAQASRLLKDALEAGLITPYDPSAGPRAIRYVPFWADPDRSSFS